MLKHIGAFLSRLLRPADTAAVIEPPFTDDQLNMLRERNALRTRSAIVSLGAAYVGHTPSRPVDEAEIPEFLRKPPLNVYAAVVSSVEAATLGSLRVPS